MFKVFLVEDEIVVREGIRKILSGSSTDLFMPVTLRMESLLCH